MSGSRGRSPESGSCVPLLADDGRCARRPRKPTTADVGCAAPVTWATVPCRQRSTLSRARADARLPGCRRPSHHVANPLSSAQSGRPPPSIRARSRASRSSTSPRVCPRRVRGDVLFGGWGMTRGGHGDGGALGAWPAPALTGSRPRFGRAPVLTSARGASAVAISEYVIAVMWAFAGTSPRTGWRGARAVEFPAGDDPARRHPGPVRLRRDRTAGGEHRTVLEMSVVALRRTAAPGPSTGSILYGRSAIWLAAADHLVLAAPATDLTRHVDRRRRAFRPVPARGCTWSTSPAAAWSTTTHLRRALDGGTVARASLDVTDPEPLPAGHWIYDHPKVFLTPHASSTGRQLFETSHRALLRQPRALPVGRGALTGVVGEDGC